MKLRQMVREELVRAAEDWKPGDEITADSSLDDMQAAVRYTVSQTTADKIAASHNATVAYINSLGQSRNNAVAYMNQNQTRDPSIALLIVAAIAGAASVVGIAYSLARLMSAREYGPLMKYAGMVKRTNKLAPAALQGNSKALAQLRDILTQTDQIDQYARDYLVRIDAEKPSRRRKLKRGDVTQLRTALIKFRANLVQTIEKAESYAQVPPA